MSHAPNSDDDRIQARAYALWEQDGRPEGRSEHHWHQARAQIEQEDAKGSDASSNEAVSAGKKKGKSSKGSAPYPGMMGDGTEEQNLDQPGDPSARITRDEVEDAFKGGEARP